VFSDRPLQDDDLYKTKQERNQKPNNKEKTKTQNRTGKKLNQSHI